MSESRPILFSGPMVRAILAGTKTQTRRIVKSQPYYRVRTNGRGVWFWERSKNDLREYINWDGKTCEELMRGGMPEFCPHGRPGDTLWVREAWRAATSWNDYAPRDIVENASIFYNANTADFAGWGKLRPPMFMPRWASRLTLLIKSVRVERLQDIQLADCAAEGAPPTHPDDGVWDSTETFQKLWDSCTRGPGSWAANPWVWRIEFERVKSKESEK